MLTSFISSLLLSTALVSNSPLIQGDKIVEPVVVYIDTGIGERAVEELRKDLNTAVKTGQNIIPIVVSSYGGSVYALLEMIDEIDNIRKTNPGIKIATIVTGKAMSAGAVLLTCGDEGLRFAAPNATIMIHDVASSSGGKVSDLKNDAAEADRLNETIFSRMEKNIGKEKGYLSSIVHLKGHTDWFMGPEEALTHNIINKIGNPSLKVEINVTLRLE